MIDRTRRRLRSPGETDRATGTRESTRAGDRKAHPHEDGAPPEVAARSAPRSSSACSCGARPCVCEIADRELEAVVRELVESLVVTLPPADAEVLRRAEILGQSTPAIARALGLDEATVETRLWAGRRRLLSRLALTLSGPRAKCC